MEKRFNWNINKKDTTIEWRYFNFKQENLSGLFSFLAFDLGKANKNCLITEIFDNGKAKGGYTLTKLDQSEIKEGDIKSGKGNSIKWINNSKVRFKGKVKDISWNLLYTKRGNAELPVVTKKFSLNRHISWKVLMPSAKVKGKLKIGNKEYDIDADGYLDGNWGNWYVYDVKWNWLQLSSWKNSKNHFIVLLGELSNLKAGKLFIIHDGELIEFSREIGEFTVTHKRWDNKNDPVYPKETIIQAENERYKAEIRAKVKNLDEIIKRNPFPLPDIFLFEENMDCWIHLKDKKNSKILLQNADGFSEYARGSYKRIRDVIAELRKKEPRKDKSQVDII